MRNRRALRHWALELTVVVGGVLLALLAAEWANDQRQKEQSYRAATAMSLELHTISTGMYWALLPWECQNNQIERLYEALLATDEPWDPSQLAIAEMRGSREGRSSIPVYFDDSRLISHFAARDNAKATGAFQGLEPDRAQSFAFLYSIAEIAYAANQRRYELSRGLLGMSLESPPSDAERRDLLRTVGELNEQHLLFLSYASGFLGTLNASGEKPESFPPGDFTDRLRDYIVQVAESRERLGDCVYEPNSEYWDQLLTQLN